MLVQFCILGTSFFWNGHASFLIGQSRDVMCKYIIIQEATMDKDNIYLNDELMDISDILCSN